MRRVLPLAAVPLLLAGCGTSAAPAHGSRPSPGRRGGGIPASLLAAVRPIGRGPRFRPGPGDRVRGACRSPLGRRQEAHLEIFGANRVVLLAAGIGTRGPRSFRDGRLIAARCFGALVTLDPTGVVYLRPRGTPTVGELFELWGQPLSNRRIASFTGGQVRVYVDGHPVRSASPGTTPLRNGAEIVLEVGPRVPPHSHFSFPGKPPPGLR